jgi:hypothetical protein
VWPGDVKDKLRALRAADPEFRLFGAARHRYETGAPVPAAELEDFERRMNIQLPDDYRESC